MTHWTLNDPQSLLLLLVIPIVVWLRGRRMPTLLMVPFASSCIVRVSREHGSDQPPPLIWVLSC